MTLQHLEVIPKELFVQFEGVSSLVRPKVEYCAEEARKMSVLARQDGFEQLYTPDIIPIYRRLKAAEQYGYYSLAEEQPLVQENKLSKDAMIGILKGFENEILYKCSICAELLDWQPEKRIEGYELPIGKNAVLYRGWDYEDEIDVSDAEVIPVKWMEKPGINVAREYHRDVGILRIVEQLGVPENTYVWADKKGAIYDCDGLNSLVWDFGFREWPDLFSWWEPWDRLSSRGALLGSRLSADEMVKSFESAMSQY